jgi:hypothetical protein
MQGDGNLVLYDADGTALVHTATHGHPGSHAVLRDDGILVVTSADGVVLWSTAM